MKMKSFFVGESVGRRLLMGALVTMMTCAPFVRAEEEINLDAIRKELRAAKASIKGVQLESEAVEPASFSVKEDGGLAQKRAALLAKENALLSQLQADGSSPIKTPTPVTPKAGAIIPVSASAITEEDNSYVRASANLKTQRLAETFEDDSELPAARSIPGAVSYSNTRSDSNSAARTDKASTRSSSTSGEFDAIKTIESSLNALRTENVSLEARLKSSNTRASSMQKELEEARDRLMIAETEVERLSGVVKTRNQETLQKFGGDTNSAPAVNKAVVTQPVAPVIAPAVRREQPKVADDVLIGTVVADKANLRTGPGKDNSPFMTVPKGARLTVETRNGEWYRVITPTGSRAWVAAEVLAFGNTNQASPSGAIRIRGYNVAIENDSLKLQNTSLRQ